MVRKRAGRPSPLNLPAFVFHADFRFLVHSHTCVFPDVISLWTYSCFVLFPLGNVTGCVAALKLRRNSNYSACATFVTTWTPSLAFSGVRRGAGGSPAGG